MTEKYLGGKVSSGKPVFLYTDIPICHLIFCQMFRFNVKRQPEYRFTVKNPYTIYAGINGKTYSHTLETLTIGNFSV